MSDEIVAPDDDDDLDGDQDSELVLIFTAEGQVVLEEDDELVWTSDDDDDFQIEFGNEFLEPELDAPEILRYLERKEFLDEDEVSAVEIEIENDGGDDTEIEPEDFT